MRRLLALAIPILLLTGCEEAPYYGPSPTPTVAPVFDSEEEALAAAEVVLVRYLEASSRMGASGGTDLSGFEGIASRAQLDDEEAYAQEMRESGEHTVGSFGYSHWELQQYHEHGDQGANLQAYVCLQLGGITYLDASGRDTSVPGHDEAIPYEVIFVTQGPKPPFILEEARKWTGRNFCAPS